MHLPHELFGIVWLWVASLVGSLIETAHVKFTNQTFWIKAQSGKRSQHQVTDRSTDWRWCVSLMEESMTCPFYPLAPKSSPSWACFLIKAYIDRQFRVTHGSFGREGHLCLLSSKLGAYKKKVYTFFFIKQNVFCRPHFKMKLKQTWGLAAEFNKWGPWCGVPPGRMAEQSWPFAQRFISVSLDKPAGRYIAGTQIPACGGENKAWWSCPISPSMERQED